jgi:hypothetical protein
MDKLLLDPFHLTFLMMSENIYYPSWGSEIKLFLSFNLQLDGWGQLMLMEKPSKQAASGQEK